jgi:hypothetical protein
VLLQFEPRGAKEAHNVAMEKMAKMSESLIRATVNSVKFYEGVLANYGAYQMSVRKPLPIAQVRRRLKEIQEELSEARRN